MQTDEIQILKEALDTFQKQGLAITVQWNAGGDERICVVVIGGKENVVYQNLAICDCLTELVIQCLHLPEVGDVYHHGRGIIQLDENGQIVIQFNAKSGHYNLGEYYDEETEEYQKIEETLAPIHRLEYVEDPLSLRNLLHRADIHLLGRINRNKQTEASLEIQVRQGDEIIFTRAQQKPYLEWIEKILLESLIEMEKQEMPFKKGKYYELFYSAEVKAKLTQQPQVLFEVNPSQQHFQNYEEKKMVLVN